MTLLQGERFDGIGERMGHGRQGIGEIWMRMRGQPARRQKLLPVEGINFLDR